MAVRSVPLFAIRISAAPLPPSMKPMSRRENPAIEKPSPAGLAPSDPFRAA